MVLDEGPFFHGTKADLREGELLTAGFRSNYRPEVVMNHIYFTALVDGAGLAAELAPGEDPPRVYAVEPAGAFENDPNVTDKKFPGNPTRSYRSREPLGSSVRSPSGPDRRLKRSRCGATVWRRSGRMSEARSSTRRRIRNGGMLGRRSDAPRHGRRVRSFVWTGVADVPAVLAARLFKGDGAVTGRVARGGDVAAERVTYLPRDLSRTADLSAHDLELLVDLSTEVGLNASDVGQFRLGCLGC